MVTARASQFLWGAISQGAGFLRKYPLISQTAGGAAAGFALSGGSGWGALAGAGVGTLTGGVGKARAMQAAERNRPVMKVARSAEMYGAAAKTLISGPPKIMQHSGVGMGRVVNMSSRTMVSGPPTIGMGGMTLGSTLISPARTMPGIPRTMAPAYAARRATLAGMGPGVNSHMSQVRNIIGETKAAHSKALRQWEATVPMRAAKGRLVGAMVGGGIAGAAVFGISAVGSSFGGRSRSPHGTTFSGMGNGTVGGY